MDVANSMDTNVLLEALGINPQTCNSPERQNLREKWPVALKVFRKVFGQERLAKKPELADDVMSVVCCVFLELVQEEYPWDEANWYVSIKNSVNEYLMENVTIITPRRRQSEGVKPIKCPTNMEEPVKNRRCDSWKLQMECREALELIEWIATAGDNLDEQIIKAAQSIIHEEGLDKVNNAKIARTVGCDPKTVNARRQKMYEVYLANSP